MTTVIKLSDLKRDVEAGMKRVELCTKYTGGNNAQLTKLLKTAGLKIRKFKKPTFILENDLLEESINNTQETAPPTHGFTPEEEAKMYAEAAN